MKTYVNIYTTARIPHIGGMSTHIEGVYRFMNSNKAFNIKLFSRISFNSARRKAESGGSSSRNVLLYSIFVLTMISISFFRFSFKRGDLNIYHDCFAIISSRFVSGRKILYFHGELANELLALNIIKNQDGYWYRLFIAVERLALIRADIIVAVDTRLKEYLKRVHGIEAVLKHNFVTESQFLGTKKFKPRRIILSRRLVEKNGVIYALEALEKINELRVEFEVDIYGSGVLLEVLRKRFEVYSWVNFRGDIDNSELRKVLPRYWATIVPSIPVGDYVEATSISALEAMCDGTLVLASNVGGLSELLVDSVDGVLFEPKSSSAIVDAIKRADLSLNYDCLVDTARQKIEDHYSVEQYVDFLLTLRDL